MNKLFAMVLLAMLAGCRVTEGNELGFKSSEPEKMAQIKHELSTRGIPFREDERGIFYDKKHKETFQAIVAELESSLALRFEDAALNALALKVLTDMGIRGRLEKRADGEWVAWSPKTDQEGREAQERIHTAIMASIQEKAAEKCKERNISAASTDSGRSPC